MCSYCGSSLILDRSPGFNETCPDCGHDLHVCLNCSFYKPGLHWDCAETIDQVVSDKGKRNFCDFFRLDPKLRQSGSGNSPAKEAAQKARDDLDRLFGS